MSDQYEGQGGSYTLNPKTGARTLVARTAEAPPPEQDAPAEPADAGFFTPADPAAPADATITTE